MIDPALLEVLVGVARAAGPLLASFLDALTEDHREAVLEALARDRAALDGIPSTAAVIAEMRERHLARVRAHEQARAETVVDRYRIAPTTAGFLRRLATSEAFNATDRDEARVAAKFVDAGLDGELVPAHNLAAPRGDWSEPSGSED